VFSGKSLKIKPYLIRNRW